MSNSDGNAGCLSIAMLIGTGASWLISGVLAWDWVEPDSFGRAILFLIAWALLGKLFDFVLGLIIVGLINMME
jgi:hypothetical protein